MKTITIGDQLLEIKDYFCDDGNGYIDKKDYKLWLYINIADVCNGHCTFCINPCKNEGSTSFDISLFRNTLYKIKDHINGISITGGEPMLFPKLVDDVIGVITEVYNRYIETDLVTNGFNITGIKNLKHLRYLDSVHISRHRIDDALNNIVFGIPVATAQEIKEFISGLSDPGKIVFNCILMKEGINSVNGIADYLEFAAELNVHNTSFIGMAPANSFCIENYVDPADLDFRHDARFTFFNRLQDHAYCKCSSGSYEAKTRDVRFYYRCIGSEKAPYARQLVYTADNRLLAGFNGKEIHFHHD